MLGSFHGHSPSFWSSSVGLARWIQSDSVDLRHKACQRQRQCVRASKAKSNHSKATKKNGTPKKPLEAPDTPQPAPRIDPNSNIPVRQQQRYLKIKKAAEAAPFRPTPRAQSYTKPKLDAEERAEYNRQREEQAAKNATRKADMASLVNLYGTNGDEQPPVLLVDGYNVLCFWRNTYRQDMISRMTMDQARRRLEDDLVSYSQLRQVKVVVVYDAMQRPADPVYIDIRRSVRETKAGLIDVVYCSDQEADTWILKESIILKQEKSCPYVVVASGDRVLVDSVSQHGAFMTPARILVQEVKQALKDLGIAIKETQQIYAASSLSQGMSSQALKQLQGMRQRSIESDRARAGIPINLHSPSVPLRFPKRESND